MPVRSERFLELYISETREHLQLLTHSVLRLERNEPGAVEEAFRAAHTIKGLAAAMGHRDAADRAHRLEDRLAAVRGHTLAMDARLADELLESADALDAAIRRALAVGDGASAATDAPSLAPATFPAGTLDDSAVPVGTCWIGVVRFATGAALPEARAEMVRRSVAGGAGVLGVWPAPGEPFAGELRIFIDERAIRDSIEAQVRACGEIDDVRFVDAAPRSATAPASAVTPLSVHASSSTMRVDRTRLDELAEGIAELAVMQARSGQSAEGLGGDRAASVITALQQTVLDMRMVPVSTAFERFPRLVRDAARSAGKDVSFELDGGDIELDQAVLDALVDPLVHVLRNAVDHGIESPAVREAAGKPRKGTLRIETKRERNSVQIRVSDDGAGVARGAVTQRARDAGLLAGDAEPSDDDVLRLLFQPGFSTAAGVTELSGRGVGLDVVAARIRGLGGAIEMSTTPGEGTTFTLRVPITLALAHALRVRVGAEEYGLPITHVSEVITLDGSARTTTGGWGSVEVRGLSVPLVDLGRVLGAGGGPPSAAVVAELGERRVALAVDRVLGHEQILVKSFDAPAGMLPVFSGATLLPDGRPALLIDPLSVL